MQAQTTHDSHTDSAPAPVPTPHPRRPGRFGALLQRRLSSMRSAKSSSTPMRPLPTTTPLPHSSHPIPDRAADPQPPSQIPTPFLTPNSPSKIPSSSHPSAFSPSSAPHSSPRRSSVAEPSSPSSTKRPAPFRLRRQTTPHLYVPSSSEPHPSSPSHSATTHSPHASPPVPPSNQISSSQSLLLSSNSHPLPTLTFVPQAVAHLLVAPPHHYHSDLEQHSVSPSSHPPSPDRPASPALTSTSFANSECLSTVSRQTFPFPHFNNTVQPILHPTGPSDDAPLGRVKHLSALFQRQVASNLSPNASSSLADDSHRFPSDEQPRTSQVFRSYPRHDQHLPPPRTVVNLVAHFESEAAAEAKAARSPKLARKANLLPELKLVQNLESTPDQPKLKPVLISDSTVSEPPLLNSVHVPDFKLSPSPEPTSPTITPVPGTSPQPSSSPPASPKLSEPLPFLGGPVPQVCINNHSLPLSRSTPYNSVDADPNTEVDLAVQSDLGHAAATTDLDFSPIEPYSSLNLRAERVANALERIGKRVDDFNGTGVDGDNDSGIATRDALIPLMIEGMQQHRADRKVADRALNTLRRLTVSDVCRARIGECGGINVIVDIMRCHSLLVRIQTQACLALANLAYENDPNKEEIIRCGGLRAIVVALSQHKSVELVQSWGCLAIRNITNYSGPKKHELALTIEAIGVLLYALESYPKSSMVQQNGLIALVNIGGASPYAVDKIREQGGVHTLVLCLQNNIRSDKLSEVGLCLARLLVEDEKNQRAFGDARGVEAITSIMDEHPRCLGIAVKGCAAFRHLAFHRQNRDMLGKCGGIRTIVSALEVHRGADADSMSYFLKALSNVTFDSLTNKMLAGRAGAIERTLRVLKDENYRDDEKVVVDSCRALRNLVDGVPQNHRLLVRQKGISLILDTLRLHGLHSEQVAEHSIAVFVNMVSYRPFINMVNEGNGEILKVVKDMMDAHVRNENVVKQAQSLLVLVGPGGGSGLARLHRQGSILRDLRMQTSTDRTLRSARSHHRYSSGEERQTRLQRLRSLPLPLSRYRGEMMGSRQAL